MSTNLPECPVKVGDRFYRKNRCTEIGAVIPDRIEVLRVDRLEKPMLIHEEYIDERTGLVVPPLWGYYKIHGKYIYHEIGPKLELDFSDSIFADPAWVIEKTRRTA